jgi:hypothetical protein
MKSLGKALHTTGLYNIVFLTVGAIPLSPPELLCSNGARVLAISKDGA